MTIQTQSTEQSQATTPVTKDLGEMSFAEYEAARKGGATPEEIADKSAPAEAEKPKPEQKQSEESDTSETESEEQDSDESEAEDEESEAKDESKPKKKSGRQRRIDKLRQREIAAKQEAEYWKREALKHAQGAPKHDAQESSKPESKTEADGKPKPEDYDSHEEWLDARDAWRDKQRDEAEAQKKREADHKKVAESHAERVKAFEEKTPDFEDVQAGVEHIPHSAAFAKEIIESENGPELYYELAKDPAEFKRVNELPPQALARALGRLEAKIAAKANASDEAKPETKKITQAPKPIAPIGAGKGTVAKSIDDPNISFAEYERIRTKQLKSQGRI